MVLSHNNRLHIEDGAGVVVNFESLEQAEQHLGISLGALSGVRVTYQPDDNMHLWNGAKRPIPYEPFEELINSVALWRSRLDDPYYTISLEEAKALKTEHIISIARAAKRAAFASGTNRLSSDGLQSLEDIQTQALLAKASGDAAWTIDVILENLNPDGTNKRMTLNANQVINFIRDLWARNEQINQIAQNKIDAVNAMTDVATIKAYE